MVRSKSVRLSVVILILLLLWAAAAIWIVPRTSQSRYYEYRFVECDSNDLVVALASIFDIVLPPATSEIRAAKTIPIEGVVHFIVRFSSDANSVASFVDTLQKEKPGATVHLFEYAPGTDTRKAHLYPPPAWFTEPIKQGRILIVTLGSRRMEIYVDAGREGRVIVYSKGWFSQKHADREKRQNRGQGKIGAKATQVSVLVTGRS